MTPAWARAVCRLLIALAVCTSAFTPYSTAQAALIGTGAALPASAERGAVLAFLDRAEVARELQAYGLDPAAAKDRVAALSDDEVGSLAGKINVTPAGADVAGLLLLVVVIAVIWWAWKR